MTAEIEGHHLVVLRQIVDLIGEVLLGTAEAVDQHERRTPTGHDGLERDPVIGHDLHQIPLRPHTVRGARRPTRSP